MESTSIGKAYIKRNDGYKIISLRTGPNIKDPFITPEPDIVNDSIVDILSFPNEEFTEIQYNPSSDSPITGFVKTIYLRFVCECCLLDKPKELTDYKLWHIEHQMRCHPKIKINRYTFKLLYKMEDTDYIKIKIRNITQQIDFIVYPSNSQGNIYRFCSFDIGTHLYKGDNDYVTETFIHMDLQKFINDNFHNLVEKPIEICPMNTDDSHLDLSKSLTYKEYINKRLINLDIDDPFLNITSKLKCGEGFSHIYNIIGIISDIQGTPSKFLSSDLVVNFNKLITDILLIFGKGKTGDNRREILEIYLELKGKKDKGLSSDLLLENKNQIIKLYLEFISFYMFSNYNIKFDTIKHLYDTGEFSMKKIPTIKLNFKFYSIVIENKHNKHNYTIIWAMYEYTDPHNSKYNNNYSIVLNMIPHQDNGDNINSLGLYKKFITIGIYLCKIFEYPEGVATLVRGSELLIYYFVGHLYDNLFPIKQIIEHRKKK
jgi:hypothetical protein